MKLLADIIRYHFDTPQDLHLLDLGGGDGVLTEYLAERYPNNAFTLLDGSADMLARAQQRLTGKNAAFIQQTFEEYIETQPKDQTYDFVFSSNAIHHLDWLGKSQLYAKLFREIKFGGAFVNIDVVQAPTERSERWQFAMWEDWINEKLAQAGGETGTHDGLPQMAKAKPENKPSGLLEQLELLRHIGFRDVTCFYKYSVFAMLGGTK
jgi:tRNA (cmo5U34)-methyltransferase